MYLSLPQSLRREQTFASLALLPKRTRKAHKRTSNVSKIQGALNNNDGSNQTHGKHAGMLLDWKLKAQLYLWSETVAGTSRMLVHPADDAREGFLPIGAAVGATSSQ